MTDDDITNDDGLSIQEKLDILFDQIDSRTGDGQEAAEAAETAKEATIAFIGTVGTAQEIVKTAINLGLSPDQAMQGISALARKMVTFSSPIVISQVLFQLLINFLAACDSDMNSWFENAEAMTDLDTIITQFTPSPDDTSPGVYL